MSVTCLNIPSSGGSGGLVSFNGPVPSSEASCLRPNTITTRPAGLNLITMSEPLSAAQMLSSLSILTVCANDQAYRFFGIYRHARDFAEVHVYGKFQKIGNGIKSNFRHLLFLCLQAQRCNDKNRK